jgi:hypothetical protein
MNEPRTNKELQKAFVGCEILTAVVMKSSIFWDITPCSPLKVNWRFGGTCRLHLQGQRISKARNKRERWWQAKLCLLLLDLFFDPKDGRDMFLRKVGWLATDYMALYSRRQNSLKKSQIFCLRLYVTRQVQWLSWSDQGSTVLPFHNHTRKHCARKTGGIHGTR